MVGGTGKAGAAPTNTIDGDSKAAPMSGANTTATDGEVMSQSDLRIADGQV